MIEETKIQLNNKDFIFKLRASEFNVDIAPKKSFPDK